MNVEKACFLLNVSVKEIHTPMLKKKYKMKCLQMHPDKRGNKESFIQLKEAYDFLRVLPKEPSFLDSVDETLLRQYLLTIYQSDVDWFKHPLFVRYFIEPVREHLHSYKTFILHPTLDQLLRKDIYYLEEEQLYIPLWHQEIVFHGKIKILIHPQLPEGIEIDEDNNLCVSYRGGNILVLGSISISIHENEKKEKRVKQKGIPRISTSIYQVDELSDILLC